MKEILTISLNKIKFWGFHGVFPEEKILGNWFTVNLDVSVKSDVIIGTLQQTIDYSSLYAILKEEMSRPTELLEVLVEKIKEKILSSFSNITCLRIEIHKQKPAIGLLDGNSFVELKVEL